MHKATLHYIYDPFCGWCYGAAPMISAALEISELHVLPHSVGMLSGDKKQLMSAQWRDFVRPHEERISFYSKQIFGSAYVDGVLEHQDVLLDSSPPSAAMLAAEQIDERGVQMLKALQIAYYQSGKAIADDSVITQVAHGLGYEPDAFQTRYLQVSDSEITQHLNASNEMLKQLGAKGFPAFGLEIDGKIETLPLGHYLTRPLKFKADIEQRLSTRPGNH